MNEMINRKVLSVVLLLGPALAFGQGATSYQCTMDGKQRRVVILTEPGVPVPCEVQYHKDTEAPGQVQVLWSATNHAGYCEEKTQEFIGKLQGWGWSCAAADGTSVEPELKPVAPAEAGPESDPVVDPDPTDEAEEVTDDTSDLEPAG